MAFQSCNCNLMGLFYLVSQPITVQTFQNRVKAFCMERDPDKLVIISDYFTVLPMYVSMLRIKF